MSKVLISDEITQKTISLDKFQNHSGIDDSVEYPYVYLTNGKKFYFNRFVFL